MDKRFTKDRVRLTLKEKKQVIASGDDLVAQGLSDGDVLIFKDLGPQISWKLVFFLEYLGPMLIHALFYYYPTLWYGKDAKTHLFPSFQFIGFLMVQLHFLKRELETEFVHRFSNGTMPWTNLPKNCFHYHVLGGLLIAYPLYAPTSSHYFGEIKSESTLYILLGIWIFAQLSNLKTHLILRNLRPEGSKVRKIPKGYGFDLVSCPNYTFEILGWIIFSIITGSLYAWFFTVVGAVQMYFWAVKKHQRYKKEFGKEYPRRKVLIPLIL